MINDVAFTYLNRIFDDLLEKKLKSSGAVLVEGPKWCGKSTTGKMHANSVVYLQNPLTRSQDIALAYNAPDVFLNQEPPFLIDEWQEAPILWDSIRFEVDKRRSFGQFILTGSATPLDSKQKEEIKHSGIGRIAKIRMWTMSLYESGDSSGSVSLSDMFSGENIGAICEKSLADYAYLTCRGGWPMSIGVDHDISLEQAVNYVDEIVSTDFVRAGGPANKGERVRHLMASYARNISTPASKALIIRDMKRSGEERFDDETFSSYYTVLSNLFVFEELEAWNPNIRSKARVQSARIRHFTDPSIAAASLGIGPNDLMADLKSFGLLFESLCIRDLRIYAYSLNGKLYHYRDSNGLEADAVIHLKDGRYALVEVKFGRQEDIDTAASHLLKLANLIDTDSMSAPSCLIIITAQKTAYRRPDGVYVVPLACLKP